MLWELQCRKTLWWWWKLSCLSSLLYLLSLFSTLKWPYFLFAFSITSLRSLTFSLKLACKTQRKNIWRRDLKLKQKSLKRTIVYFIFYIIYCPFNVNVQRNLSYFIMLVSLWKKINKRFFCSSQLYYIAFIVNRWAWFFCVDWATKWTRLLFFCLLTI